MPAEKHNKNKEQENNYAIVLCTKNACPKGQAFLIDLII